MYGIDESNSVAGGFTKMNAGITENVSLTRVAVADWNGTAVLDFTFMDEAGGEFQHRVFPVDEAKAAEYAKANLTNMKPFSGEQGPAFAERKKKAIANLPNAVREAYKKAGDHILCIMLPFISREAINASLSAGVKSFGDYANKIVTLMDSRDKGKLVRVKLLYNKKDRLQFPTSTFKPFIQPMSEPNALKIEPKDKVTPETPTPEASYEQPTAVDSFLDDDAPDLFTQPVATAQPVLANAGDTDDWD